MSMLAQAIPSWPIYIYMSLKPWLEEYRVIACRIAFQVLLQIRLLHIGLLHIRFLHIGLLHIGLLHIRLLHIGLLHIGLLQYRVIVTARSGFCYIGLLHIGLLYIGLLSIGFLFYDCSGFCSSGYWYRVFDRRVFDIGFWPRTQLVDNYRPISNLSVLSKVPTGNLITTWSLDL
jgi:hypothetical protein